MTFFKEFTGLTRLTDSARDFVDGYKPTAVIVRTKGAVSIALAAACEYKTKFCEIEIKEETMEPKEAWSETNGILCDMLRTKQYGLIRKMFNDIVASNDPDVVVKVIKRDQEKIRLKMRSLAEQPGANLYSMTQYAKAMIMGACADYRDEPQIATKPYEDDGVEVKQRAPVRRRAFDDV